MNLPIGSVKTINLWVVFYTEAVIFTVKVVLFTTDKETILPRILDDILPNVQL